MWSYGWSGSLSCAICNCPQSGVLETAAAHAFPYLCWPSSSLPKTIKDPQTAKPRPHQGRSRHNKQGLVWTICFTLLPKELRHRSRTPSPSKDLSVLLHSHQLFTHLSIRDCGTENNYIRLLLLLFLRQSDNPRACMGLFRLCSLMTRRVCLL